REAHQETVGAVGPVIMSKGQIEENNTTENGSLSVETKIEMKHENKSTHENVSVGVKIEHENEAREETHHQNKINVKLQVEKRKDNKTEIKYGKINVRVRMEVIQENRGNGTVLRAKLSNGKYAEVKVMPDTASERALERLRLKNCEENCQIELKEVDKDQEKKVVYEVKAKKKARLLGFLPVEMTVEADVDAENGEVIQVKKPWWAFLVFGEE
ncbi:MAG: hypothetical protein J7L45_02295, partial [Candidatus Aenigmarchaeota archaeon]|nr:hypothetical protein [Candidatus Aenigmarchaeota archaeon]